MRKVTNYLENPFDDNDISMAELIAFSTDHSARLIANNGSGLFDNLISPPPSRLIPKPLI